MNQNGHTKYIARQHGCVDCCARDTIDDKAFSSIGIELVVVDVINRDTRLTFVFVPDIDDHCQFV